jgi:integrase
MGYSVKAILDKRYQKTDYTYPVKIQVYINGTKVRYSTKYSLTEEDWQKLNSLQNTTSDLRKIKKKLDDLIQDAFDILEDLHPLTHQSFEQEFFTEVNRHNTKISIWFGEYIKELRQANRSESTVKNYETTLNSLQQFQANLTFQDISPKFLQQYELWMKNKGRSKATIGIYLRHLRSIFNYAIHDRKIIKADIYPFGKKKYVIKSQSRKKQSLSFDQIKSVDSFSTKLGSSLDYARDIWIFQYLVNGSNTKDICRLKYSDLDWDNNTFSFFRAKTENTETDATPISGFLHERAKQIILKWGNQDRSGFVFPFYNEFTGKKVIDAKRERTILGFVRRRLNRNLSKIQKELGLTVKLTTAIARHSFARRLNDNFQRPDISDQMGHQYGSTTDNYINSLDYQYSGKNLSS